jgi:hypothetical protein
MNETAEELERAMRRVEAKKLWLLENHSISVDEMMRLSCAFMDYAMHNKDYRFLNTALKINDRLREEMAERLSEIEKREHDCLETLKKRLGLA